MNGCVSALSAGLRKAYPFKTELHAHTFPASKCSSVSPEELCRKYAGLGYSALCVTNHFSSGMKPSVAEWLSDLERAAAEGERLGLTVIPGVEVRLDNDGNHYLLYGVDPEDMPEVFGSLGLSIREFSEKWRGEGRFFCHAHPFRPGLTHADFSLFDGVEAFNVHPDENSRVALAAETARRLPIRLTAGTDCHEYGHGGLSALRSAFAPKTGSDIAGILKSGDYLLEIGGSIIIP